jgi:probable HAF family extracellular repeat protein
MYRLIFWIALFCVPAETTFAQLKYRLIDLGVLPGDATSSARGINNLGDVVGTSDQSLNHQAFLYTDAGGLKGLGYPPGARWSFGIGINDAGQIAVQTSFGPYSGTSGNAFRYTPAKGFKDLGNLGGKLSDPLFINAAGDVVGYAEVAQNTYEPFLYTDAGGIRRFLATNTLGSGASINARGQIAVNIGFAARYDPGRGWKSLGSFPALPHTRAGAMNAAGDVAGTASTNNGHSRHLFFYRDATGIVDLGYTGKRTLVKGMNDAGVFVGKYDDDNGTRYGFVHIPGKGLQNLNTLLTTSGWFVSDATAINNRGQICGMGNAYFENPHAIRLDPVWFALVTPVGTGCGGGSTPPTLSGGRPVLGKSWRVDVANAAPGKTGFLFVSTGPSVAVPLGGGCSVHVDFAALLGAVPLATDARGSWSLSVPLPSIPSLEGVTITLQAAVLGTTGPLGADVTNGIEAIFGQ